MSVDWKRAQNAFIAHRRGAGLFSCFANAGAAATKHSVMAIAITTVLRVRIRPLTFPPRFFHLLPKLWLWFIRKPLDSGIP